MTYSEKMLKALEEEDLAEAQLMFQKALKHDEADILTALAEELLAMGFLEEAKEIFEKMAVQTPDRKELYLPLAEIAIDNDQSEEALDYLEKITPEDECYPDSLMIAADLYQTLGMPEVSEAKLKEAEKFLPDDPVIEFAFGELYYSEERYKEALRSYLKLKGDGVEELLGVVLEERIGSSLSMMGEFEEALPYLEASLEKDDSDDNLFQLAFTCFQIKDYQKAIQYFQQLRMISPHYQSLYLYLAEALQEEEQLDEARQIALEGINENPFQVELYHFAAENAYRLHDPGASENFLKQALELGEKQDETRLTLSNLQLNERRFEEAIETIEMMEEKDNPYAQWNLAHAYDALEEYDIALDHYEQAAKELEHEPDFLKEYGIFLREEGQLEKAKHLLSHYLHHEPGDMEVASILEDLERGDEDGY